jgi:hypothetical protein
MKNNKKIYFTPHDTSKSPHNDDEVVVKVMKHSHHGFSIILASFFVVTLMNIICIWVAIAMTFNHAAETRSEQIKRTKQVYIDRFRPSDFKEFRDELEKDNPNIKVPKYE